MEVDDIITHRDLVNGGALGAYAAASRNELDFLYHKPLSTRRLPRPRDEGGYDA